MTVRLAIDDLSGYDEVADAEELGRPGHLLLRVSTERLLTRARIRSFGGTPLLERDDAPRAIELRLSKIPRALCTRDGLIIDLDRGTLHPDGFRRPLAELPPVVDIEPDDYGLPPKIMQWSIASHRDEPGPCFYASTRHNGYGHVLLEGMSRTWALDYVPSPRIVLGTKSANGHYLPFFEALGISRSQIRTARKGPILLRDLFVPSQAYQLDRGVSSRYLDTMGRIARHVATPISFATTPLYVSRAEASKRRMEDEDGMESVFAARGFRVLRPERESLVEQVRAFAGASFVAGPVGSALYSIVFSPPRTKLLVLAPDRFFTRNDLLLGAARGSVPDYIFGTSSADSKVEAMSAGWRLDTRVVQAVLDDVRGDGLPGWRAGTALSSGRQPS